VTAAERWILHADMDAFYASIEQRDRPELRGLPVIVGGSSQRGVVAAASYEARVFGVRSAMPGFMARERCPHAVFLPPDMERYARVSSEVHAVFAEFTPEIEPLALDEAFLDVTASVKLFGGPFALARQVKQRVRQRVDLAVSVGMAPSKLVAKIACTLSKPDGLLIVPRSAIEWLLAPLPVRRLWTVGPVLASELADLGIASIGDLAAHDPEVLRARFGDRAPFLQRLARGEDARGVESQREPKSYGEENTFEHDVSDLETIKSTLTAHADAVARRLRRDGYAGRTVTLKAKLGRARVTQRGERRYPLVTRSRTLDIATDDASTIRDVALELWHGSGVVEPVRLLGVSVSGLCRGRTEQLDLFAQSSAEAPRPKLGPVLDAIQSRFGRHAIGHAVRTPQKASPTHQRKRGE
jgi:DNA polymerase-4